MKKHSHAYSGPTTCDDCHIHHYGGVTSKAKNCAPHCHYMEGCTTYYDDHDHKYCTKTGPAIYLSNGFHYHCYETKVACADGHIHCIKGFTSTD